MKFLFLDDMEFRHKAFKTNSVGQDVDHVYDADSCLEMMRENEYHVIFLDHDLSVAMINTLNYNDKNGSYVVRRMVEEGLCKDSVFVLHSLNPAGRANMMSILMSAGYNSVYDVPFAWNDDYSKKDE